MAGQFNYSQQPEASQRAQNPNSSFQIHAEIQDEVNQADDDNYAVKDVEFVFGIVLNAKADQFGNHFCGKDPDKEDVTDPQYLSLKIALVKSVEGERDSICQDETVNQEVKGDTDNYLVKEVIASVPLGSIFAMNFSLVFKPVDSLSDCTDLVRLSINIFIMNETRILLLECLAVALRTFF